MNSLYHLFQYNNAPLSHKDNRAIVFINSNIPNCANLIQKVISIARVIVIGSKVDGIKEITQVLGNSSSKEVYIVAQGYPGCVYLGNSQLSFNTIIQYSSELQSWFDHSNVSASTIDGSSAPRLSFYGCNAAAGDVGEEFLMKLNRITGAKITASTSILDHDIFKKA